MRLLTSSIRHLAQLDGHHRSPLPHDLSVANYRSCLNLLAGHRLKPSMCWIGLKIGASSARRALDTAIASLLCSRSTHRPPPSQHDLEVEKLGVPSTSSSTNLLPSMMAQAAAALSASSTTLMSTLPTIWMHWCFYIWISSPRIWFSSWMCWCDDCSLPMDDSVIFSLAWRTLQRSRGRICWHQVLNWNPNRIHLFWLQTDVQIWHLVHNMQLGFLTFHKFFSLNLISQISYFRRDSWPVSLKRKQNQIQEM